MVACNPDIATRPPLLRGSPAPSEPAPPLQRIKPGNPTLRALKTMPAVVELYFYDGWQCVEEQTTSGATKKTFIFGEGIDEVIWARLPDAADLDADMDTGELVDLYCHQNSLDSVMAATEPSGTLADGRAVHFEKLMTAQQQIPKADLTNEHQGDCPPTK